MKKIFILLCACLLSACYCKVQPAHTQTPTPAPLPSSAPADQAPSALPPAQPQSAKAPQKAPGNAPAAPAAVQAATAEPVPEEQPADFTPAQAALLIEQDRQHQSLSAPVTDTPRFKKEEILSTQGRLLSPLAYEPLRADTTHAPWSNESLKFGIYYSFVKAGTAYIKTRGLINKNGQAAYVIQTTAFSASVIDSVFKVRDINYSWLSVDSLRSMGYSQSLREGNYQRDEWTTFDPANRRFYGEVKKKNESRTVAGTLNQEVLDILTSLYFVRAKPLQVGQDLVFDIVNREKQFPLIVKVLGKETVKTGAGKFDCWVVEPQLRGEGIFVVKGKSLKVWLTDDKYRMPVKMAVEVFIGSVTAELLDYRRN